MIIKTLKDLVSVVGRKLQYHHVTFYQLDRYERIEEAAAQLLFEMDTNGIVETAKQDLVNAINIPLERYVP